MSKYEKLDAAILRTIGDSPVRMLAIMALRAIAEECQSLAAGAGTSRSRWGVPPQRVLDRRLQALRKAGKIRSTSKGWLRADERGVA